MSELPLPEEPIGGDCVACLLPADTGDTPTVREGLAYCCDECAEGHDCACVGHTHGDEPATDELYGVPTEPA